MKKNEESWKSLEVDAQMEDFISILQDISFLQQILLENLSSLAQNMNFHSTGNIVCKVCFVYVR